MCLHHYFKMDLYNIKAKNKDNQFYDENIPFVNQPNETDVINWLKEIRNKEYYLGSVRITYLRPLNEKEHEKMHQGK